MKIPWPGRSARLASILPLFLFVMSGQAILLSGNSGSWPSQGSVSWALGVVVPEGASLNGSGSVVWSVVNNLSAHFSLPPLNSTDGTILLVLSAKVGSAVIQVAAGLSPTESSWKTYAWLIPNVASIPQSYDWLLNGSGPMMAPGDDILLSLSKGAGTWEGYISDLTTGRSTSVSFPGTSGATLAEGDQEVFALESYTSSISVFVRMGDVDLHSIALDGAPVTGGYYYLDGWDDVHHPLFVVGTALAPGFISAQSISNGTIYIGYSGVWQPSGSIQIGLFPFVVPLLLCALAVLGFYIIYARPGRRMR
jgi:hypothetical protein